MVRWTSEIDQILLLKLIETHDVPVDPQRIVDHWPEGYEIPTPRAIRERLVKIRSTAGTKGGKSATIRSAPTSTPRKRKGLNPGMNETPTKSTRRKTMKSTDKVTAEDDEDDSVSGDDECGIGSIIKNEKNGRATRTTDNDDDELTVTREVIGLDEGDKFTAKKEEKVIKKEHAPDEDMNEENENGGKDSAGDFIGEDVQTRDDRFSV